MPLNNFLLFNDTHITTNTQISIYNLHETIGNLHVTLDLKTLVEFGENPTFIAKLTYRHTSKCYISRKKIYTFHREKAFE